MKFGYFVGELLKYRSKQTILLNRVTCISKSTVFFSKLSFPQNEVNRPSRFICFELVLIDVVLELESFDEEFSWRGHWGNRALLFIYRKSLFFALNMERTFESLQLMIRWELSSI